MYVLAEAEIQRKGEYLGEVGGRIVAVCNNARKPLVSAAVS